MATRKLHVVDPAPAHKQRAVLKPDANPALVGEGPLDYECGKCGEVLARAIWAGMMWDVGIICAKCGTFNDTPSAIGGTVYGAVAYFPVGTYRLSSPVTAKKGVPLIGEPFPGAGPPGAGKITTMG
jgi:hypothetical protein